RNLLQYQLWGEKRVLLVPPSSSRKLLPLANNAMVSPQGHTGAENERFVRYVDGYQALLRPGEAVFMPALIWHYFDYRETSMALTLRFHRNPFIKFLSENLHTDYRIQALTWKLQDERAATPEARRAFEEIQATIARPIEDPQEKGAYLQELADGFYSRVCPDFFQGELAPPYQELLRAVWRQTEIRERSLYAPAQK
ncbi:MAG TPA: cupin-like domain-containing protein, partial [Myxococcaceae bacterium]